MHGTELLETLARCKATRAAAVMRHAERFPIVDPTQPTLAEIKPAGREAARAFGSQLNGFQRLRLFHSPVLRCLQTAECLAEGARAQGLKVELMGERREIGVDYIHDPVATGQLFEKVGVIPFVRYWFQGNVPERILERAEVLARSHEAYVRQCLETCLCPEGERSLDLHISHDWNLLILREHLLGLRHEDIGWVDYLDGLVFVPALGGLHVDYTRPNRYPTLK